MLGDGLWAKEG